MPNTQLREFCEDTYRRLRRVCADIEAFLNSTTLAQLVEEAGGDREEYEEYFRLYLSDLRHLLVNCENACERLGIVLRRAKFNPEFAEETLYKVYHNCVDLFYYPKGEVYAEDGRYSYTGHDAILFRKPVPERLKRLTLSLSKTFEYLRDELQYYETDYVTKKRMRSTS
ncbi:DUF3907 family protein [Calditerricola satsumensis]|uniref:DUF3907 family protein n=1 Tax=Calditerricola satsumensis TaxID=373054 RepID=A0A8J3B6D7_9BACI|nr:DUF3907 family protein [Calditerricola satsumensis]GGJ98784.1 hypothetical protein GCM10007043_10960 [Calditerricola satsumensis]